MRLKNKISIVTGASNGMEPYEARLFANQAVHVVLTDIQDDLGISISREILRTGGPTERFHLDVVNETDLANLSIHIMKTLGQLDVLVNNTGISAAGENLLDIDTYYKIMNINAHGVFLVMKTAVNLMRLKNTESIVNISYVSGIIGQSYVHMWFLIL